jgi:hypothetical protein
MKGVRWVRRRDSSWLFQVDDLLACCRPSTANWPG